mgnify:FL=1
MAKKDYYGVFVITDCVMKKVKDNDAKKEIVKISALPQGEIPDGFTAFCWAAFVGAKDFEGKICKKITGDDKEVTISGLQSLGIMAIPYEETFTIGDDFTAPDIVEFEKPTKQGYATISQIIYAKTENDTEALVNWGKTMETIVGGPIKMADTSNPDSPNFDPYGDYPPAATQAAEETDVFGAEYDQHMMNLYHSLYRSEREYEANV